MYPANPPLGPVSRSWEVLFRQLLETGALLQLCSDVPSFFLGFFVRQAFFSISSRIERTIAVQDQNMREPDAGEIVETGLIVLRTASLLIVEPIWRANST